MRAFKSLIAMAVLAIPVAASASPAAGQFSVRIMGGADFPIGGPLHRGTSAPVADLGALNPSLSGVSATLDVERRGWTDFFDGAFGGNAELGYGLSDNSEVFGALRYQQLGNRGGDVGSAAVPALATSLPITGNFDVGQVWSGEIGYRRYFGTTIKPYVAGRAGLSFTNSVAADIAVPDAAIQLNDTPFYRSSVSATAGVDVGVAIPIAAKVDLNVETGIRYTSNLRGDDSVLSTLGLQTLNDAGARWDVPVRAGLTFRF